MRNITQIRKWLNEFDPYLEDGKKMVQAGFTPTEIAMAYEDIYDSPASALQWMLHDLTK
jgi:hypothetical protein